MLVIDDNGIYTLKFETQSITASEINDVFDFVKINNPKKFILDLEGVLSCVNEFFQMFKTLKSQICLINTESPLLSLIYMMKYDKYVRIYLDKTTQQEDKYELINRDFVLL